MKDKIILITGSTSGLGKSITKLLSSNNSIITLGRNEDLLIENKHNLEEKYDNTNIEYFVCNYNNFDDVYKVARKIKVKYHKIDIIIHNAGALIKSSNEKISPSLKINYLSPLLLNELLIGLLLKSEKPTIFYTSTMALPKNINLDILNKSNEFGKIKTYGISKLAFNLYLKDLSIRNHEINFKIFDPTIIYTNAIKSVLPKGFKWLFPITRVIAKKPYKVAQKAILTLKSDNIEEIEYYKYNKKNKPQKILKDQEKANLITTYGKDLLNIVYDINE